MKSFSASFDTKYLKHILVCIGSIVLSGAAVITMLYHLTPSRREGLKVVYATPEIVSDTIECDSYILRDETVIEGVANASLTPNVRDGTKVRAGDCVASVYGAASPMTLDKISLIAEQIDFYEGLGEKPHGNTAETDTALSQTVIALRRSVDSGDVSSALSMKSDAVLNIRRLGVLSGRVTDASAVISSLNATLASLRASLGSVSSSVYAPSAGYYYSTVDGYEDIFAVDDIDTLTYSGFCDMVSAAEEREATDVNSCGKIVNSFRWYIACRIPAEEAATLKMWRKYSITLEYNSQNELSAQLCQLLSDGTESVAVFYCDRVDGSLDMTRCQTARLCLSSTECFCLPKEALRIYDGLQGVYVLDELRVGFRYVNVIGGTDSVIYCELAPSAGEENENSDAYKSLSGEEYARLTTNDIVITAGTGIDVGMTLDLK